MKKKVVALLLAFCMIAPTGMYALAAEDQAVQAVEAAEAGESQEGAVNAEEEAVQEIEAALQEDAEGDAETAPEEQKDPETAGAAENGEDVKEEEPAEAIVHEPEEGAAAVSEDVPAVQDEVEVPADSEPVETVEEAAEEKTENDAEDAASVCTDEESGLAVYNGTHEIKVGESQKITDQWWGNSFGEGNIGRYTVEWKSSDTSVLSVSDGKINGIKAGTAHVTGTAISDEGKVEVADILVSVFDKMQNFYFEGMYPEDKVSWLEKKAGVKGGVRIITEPENAIIDLMEVSSSNPDVVFAEKDIFHLVGSVSTGVRIRTKKNGIAEVIVKFVSCGETFEKKLVIAVGPYISMKSPANIVMNKGNSRTLEYSLKNAETNNDTVSWASNNTKVATVSQDGVVKAVSNGVAVITVTSKIGGSASCRIEVRTPVSGITLNRANATLLKGKTFQLKAAVAPASASNKAVTWKSSNTSVVTVDSTGKLTAKGKGTATVSCTAKDGSKKKATCKVTVKIPVSKITLNRASATMTKGKVFQLKATIAPSTADNKAVTWKSSNTKVVTVDSTGKMTGIGKGTAVVTCTAKDGSGVKAECKVTGK